MEFKDIVMLRYATKKFDGKKIPDAKINELLEMIRFSASSLNLQPWVIYVVTDKALRESMKASSWNQEQITTCSHLLVFCADKDIQPRIDKLAKMIPDSKAYVDMMNGVASRMDEEQKLIWAQKQIYIALGNAINGAKSLGLDSCPMEGFSSEDYAKLMKLPNNLVPTVICPVGYPADKPRPKLRFEKEYVFRYL
ncbi:MAG: NAD(P)H-dependent oxidoreductase [Nanoarchaeota archaeon]|nr:NAD(P)H-dependent oxidoreductase [Nanoarchaeota archaeon]